MSATRAPVDPPAESAQSYFRLIEEAFLRLRGAALLLAPADWQVARRWHDLAIPVDLVVSTMESVWRRRLERSAAPARLRRINSLRYFAPAVEAAWEEVARLTAADHRLDEPPIDAPARLARLGAALAEGLPRRAEWARRIGALRGSNQAIEEGLAAIDRQLTLDTEQALEAGERAAIAAAVERRLAPLSGRLTRDQTEEARHRLFEQELRRRASLPILSLFSPAARGPE